MPSKTAAARRMTRPEPLGARVSRVTAELYWTAQCDGGGQIAHTDATIHVLYETRLVYHTFYEYTGRALGGMSGGKGKKRRRRRGGGFTMAPFSSLTYKWNSAVEKKSAL